MSARGAEIHPPRSYNLAVFVDQTDHVNDGVFAVTCVVGTASTRVRASSPRQTMLDICALFPRPNGAAHSSRVTTSDKATGPEV